MAKVLKEYFGRLDASDIFPFGYDTGVALLVRTVFIESVGRHERLFSRFKPAFVAQFTERVAMVRGRLDSRQQLQVMPGSFG